jgi:hypothetical protein
MDRRGRWRWKDKARREGAVWNNEFNDRTTRVVLLLLLLMLMMTLVMDGKNFYVCEGCVNSKKDTDHDTTSDSGKSKEDEKARRRRHGM